MNRLHTTTALERLFPKETLWDYGSDFNRLWQMEPLDGSHAIIVWADTPIDPDVHPVDTLPYLTPFDWAITARSKNPNLRVTVLDLRGGERDKEDKDRNVKCEKARHPALHWFRTQRPESIPWLRRLVVKELVSVPDVDELRKLLTNSPTIEGTEPPTKEDDGNPPIVQPLDALRRLPVCQVDVTRDADHHAIANLIGPLLLLRNPAASDADGEASHREALRQVLQAAGFAPKPKAPTGDDEARARGGEAVNMADLGRVRLVLVDDQWHHGWAEWVAERLGLPWDSSRAKEVRAAAARGPECVAGKREAGVSLWVSRAPHWMLNRVKDALGAEKKDARFKLSLTGGGSECNEILLFDLRLIPLGSFDEITFSSEVAKLAQRFKNGGAWPPIENAKELDRVTARKVGNDLGTDDEATVLTLLPRLIAHTDLSLPIVLFSSTGRRDIVDKFKNYDSIITTFEKPRLLGYRVEDVLQDTRMKWKIAIEQAAQLVAARQLCRRILAAAAQSEVVDRRALPELRHFELYLDESGKSGVRTDPKIAEPERRRFVIGGLLVGYRSENECGPMELRRRMEAKGLRWWPEQYGDHYLIKNQEVVDDRKDLPGGALRDQNEIMGLFLECLEGMQAYGVCAEYRTDDAFKQGGKLLDPLESDNRYRLVLSTMLELILFDLLPQITEVLTISVFVATRIRVAREFEDKEKEIQQFNERFGCFLVSPYKVTTFNEDAAFPLVVEISQRRRGSLSVDRLKHARGVTLAYPELGPVMPWTKAADKISVCGVEKALNFMSPKWPSTRHQHYVADIIAHFCRQDGGRFDDGSNISSIFERGMYDVCDTRLGALLIAARALDIDDRAGAILELANVEFTRPFERRSAALLLLKRLAQAIREDFTGQDFCLLEDGIEIKGLPEAHPASPQAAQSASPQAERGTILRIWQDRGFGFIQPEAGGADCHFWLTLIGRPEEGMRVEFERYRPGTGKNRGKWTASWVRALA